MKEQSVDGFVQPVHDRFMSEYPPACNQRVEWLCGFSGSAGVAVVLAEKAALLTDGRYTLQAAQQVDAQQFELHNSGTLLPEAWAARELAEGSVLGYDAELFTRDMLARYEAALAPKRIILAPVPNLVDAAWKDRPPEPATPLFIHGVEYAGKEAAQKRAEIAAALKEKGLRAALISAPDAVCWLLNIRARDVECTPLLLATAIIHDDGSVVLFCKPERCNEQVRQHLGEAVQLVPPQGRAGVLATYGGERLLLDSANAPVADVLALKEAGAEVVFGQDVCTMPKACKNEVEINGIRAAHLRDGVAIVKLLCWLDGEVEQRAVTELEVCDQLLAFRTLGQGFLEPSFNTISGSGEHGAIVHYRATPQSNRALQKGELFLLDSGGQYPDGTTDITRTVAIGVPAPEMRDRFTRVLKGHIALAMAIFPEGTSGSQLDALARQFLWQAELDYDHGTGHGVGCFLGVHEGPQRISKRGGDVALRPGMVISNEPGYYKNGAYGIRIENLVTVVELRVEAGGRRWLGFDTLTCAPIDTRCVDVNLLTHSERQWLNAYHHWVLGALWAQLEPSERRWLEAACKAI